MSDTTVQDEMEALLTPDDVCRLLGVTPSWIRAEISAGRLSHIRLGQRKIIRFRQSHLEKYLDSREHVADQA